MPLVTRLRRSPTAAAWAAIAVTAVWAVTAAAPAARAGTPSAPEPALSRPFVHDTEGYSCFRIPAVITTRDGALLAFAEARVADCEDVGDIDLVFKRSTDGGRTWSPLSVLRGSGHRGGFGNPSPVVDAASGRVSVLYTHNSWTRDGERRLRGSRTLHSVYSTDGGTTWAAGGVLGPLKPAGWSWVSVGPGHGVQLRRGPHTGRLIVPGDHDTRDGSSGAQLYYSDDGGRSWRLGAVYQTADDRPNPGELTVVERVDGALYVSARNSEKGHPRLAGTSRDGGETFTSEGFTLAPGLDTPPAAGSLLRLRATDDGDPRNRLLLSVPARPGPNTSIRRRMTIRSSYDEGLTWQTAATVITTARAGYSDLTELLTGEIGLLYETGRGSSHGTITFTAFTARSLDGGAPRAAVCPVPATGSAWMADHRGPGQVRATSTVTRRIVLGGRGRWGGRSFR